MCPSLTDPHSTLLFDQACQRGDAAEVLLRLPYVNVNHQSAMGMALAVQSGHQSVLEMGLPFLSQSNLMGLVADAAQAENTDIIRLLASCIEQEDARRTACTRALVYALNYRSASQSSATVHALARHADLDEAVCSWMNASIGDLPINIHWGMTMVAEVFALLTPAGRAMASVAAAKDPHLTLWMEKLPAITTALEKDAICAALPGQHPPSGKLHKI